MELSEVRLEVVRQYQAGRLAGDLASELGVGTQTIINWLTQEGVRPRSGPRGGGPSEKTQQILKQLESGVSPMDIALAMKIGVSSVYRVNVRYKKKKGGRKSA